jgi:hypothetical protein
MEPPLEPTRPAPGTPVIAWVFLVLLAALAIMFVSPW